MITKFNNFLNEEAIPPSKFRPFMKIAKEVNYQDRYKEKFEELKAKYDGDRNAMRIFIPLLIEKKASETQHEIEELMVANGVRKKDIDYIAGTFRFPYEEGGRIPNTARIGKFLAKWKRPDLLPRFDSDPVRSLKGEKDDLEVCISRHPYDVVGADTDRRWINCMSLFHYNRFQKAWLATGGSVKYLPRDVKKGTLVSFLIKKTDRNIQDPLGDISIKPYINDSDPTDMVLVPDNRVYGLPDEDFKRTVFAFADEFNGGKVGYYKIAKGLYNDNFLRIKQKNEFDESWDDPARHYAKKHLPADYVIPSEKKKK